MWILETHSWNLGIYNTAYFFFVQCVFFLQDPRPIVLLHLCTYVHLLNYTKFNFPLQVWLNPRSYTAQRALGGPACSS